MPHSDTASRQKAEAMWGSPHVFPFYKGRAALPFAPYLKNCYFMYFVHFSTNDGGRVSPDPVSSSQSAVEGRGQNQMSAGTKEVN